MKIFALNKVWVLMLVLGLEMVLGLCVYFFQIRDLEFHNLNLEKNISAEKILENKMLKNIEKLKLKNNADQASKIIFNTLMSTLPLQENLESVILNLSEEARMAGLEAVEIKLAGFNLLNNFSQEPENLSLLSLNISMTGAYGDFVHFYEEGILKKYPVVKIQKLNLEKKLSSNQKLQIAVGLDFMILRQISD